MRRMNMLACASIFMALTVMPARATGSEQALIDAAATTVAQMKQSTGFARSGLLRRAKAALIVPRAIRGAFIVGAQGGAAVLVQNKGGRWSSPAFYNVGAVSIGLQIGGEELTSVLLVMTDRALDRLLKPSNATAGAQATVTAARYNADTVAQLGGADVVVWSTGTGAFAGVNLDLKGLQQDSDADAAYYGKAVDASAVFAGTVSNPADAKLRRAF